jgi:hypothetical protein
MRRGLPKIGMGAGEGNFVRRPADGNLPPDSVRHLPSEKKGGVNHVHPDQISQLADDRRRQMRARAEQKYLAGQVLALARAARRAERAERRMRRVLRRALRLRAEPRQ